MLHAYKSFVLAALFGFLTAVPVSAMTPPAGSVVGASVVVNGTVNEMGGDKVGTSAELKEKIEIEVRKSPGNLSLWQRFRNFFARLSFWRAEKKQEKIEQKLEQEVEHKEGGSSGLKSGKGSEKNEGDRPVAGLTGEIKAVTLADNNSVLKLMVGQRFVLRLGEGYNWSLGLEGSGVVSKVKNLMMVRGAQGVFVAEQVGKTELNAAGEPVCRSSVPACGQPSILFKITIEVAKKSSGICTDEYAPVCGLVQVQCVRAPCPPLLQTFSNRCVAEAAGATEIKGGACGGRMMAPENGGEIKIKTDLDLL
jgi:hypothetical protein